MADQYSNQIFQTGNNGNQLADNGHGGEDGWSVVQGCDKDAISVCCMNEMRVVFYHLLYFFNIAIIAILK